MRTKTLLTLALSFAAGAAWAQGMPLTLRDASASTADDWAKAAPLLKAAIECRTALTATPAVRAVFKATNDALDGDHTLPEPLTVFGSLKTMGVSIFLGGEDEGSSYTVKPEGVTLPQVVKAANLKKDGPRYIRKVRDGIIEASEPRPGEVQIACIRGGGAQ
ncbi:hypothetical protein [Cupriavidus sp. UYPR2.512]|uniref:hypothetical protein n=1 Tax=Cupriavidus sp. UYPR2.512 TaxID=1080187 RepID=UPI0003772B43|nr:hypothetical protein [Cupriavidus sp. UYPR2.512]UIF85745.1 hypothetical protein KAF44_16980 [Cupriavidus necator]